MLTQNIVPLRTPLSLTRVYNSSILFWPCFYFFSMIISHSLSHPHFTHPLCQFYSPNTLAQNMKVESHFYSYRLLYIFTYLLILLWLNKSIGAFVFVSSQQIFNWVHRKFNHNVIKGLIFMPLKLYSQV